MVNGRDGRQDIGVACEKVQVRCSTFDLSFIPKELTNYCRINEFNVEDVLALFFPYHESPHFAKMLSILHIKCVLIHSQTYNLPI